MKTSNDIPPYLNLSLEDMVGEVWKDVIGYEGLYQVSNKGRVKSLVSNRIRKLVDNGKGYLEVQLKGHHHYIHRMVATAFCENNVVPARNYVNHKNGDKTDNRAANLEWCTHKENLQHASKNHLLHVVEIYQYDRNGNYMCSHRSVQDAAKSVKTTPSSIVGNCTGYTHLIKGFTFRYIKADKIEVTKRQFKHVLQYSLDDVLIREWDSVQQVHDELGFKKNSIVCNCVGKTRTCNGFIFKYK